LTTWVNNKDVKKALHVAEDAYFFDSDGGGGLVYNSTSGSVFPIY